MTAIQLGKVCLSQILNLRVLNFISCPVAETVVNTEQIFRGNLLKVHPLEAETFEDSVEKLTKDEGKESRTIMVFGLPEDATEKGLYIHFQKKKNGGGDIEESTLLPGGKAMVVFEDPAGL